MNITPKPIYMNKDKNLKPLLLRVLELAWVGNGSEQLRQEINKALGNTPTVGKGPLE